MAMSAIISCVGIVVVHRVAYTPKSAVKIATRPVGVATQDISAGGPIDAAIVTIARWPLGTVPFGSYTSIDSVIGRVASRAIYKGEVIVPRLATDTTRRISK